jgi:hypothetical protein
VITSELRQELRQALTLLSGQCDGARERDGVGFNKPDSHIGRWLSLAGLEDDATAECAFQLVYKYERQLGGKENFPTIYKNK